MAFELHPRLRQDCIQLGDMALCRLLLMNDSRYPWFILVPRRPDVTEICRLAESDQVQLLRESSHLSRHLLEWFQGHKLNIAALGNLVPQLHVHHIGDPQPYSDGEIASIRDRASGIVLSISG